MKFYIIAFNLVAIQSQRFQKLWILLYFARNYKTKGQENKYIKLFYEM